jgi:spermidine synthase
MVRVMNEDEWQMRNRAAIMARVSDVRALPEGTLFTEPCQTSEGERYVVVTKTDDRALLWLMNMAEAETAVVQSDIDLSDPLTLVDPYTQAAMLGLLWTPSPRRIHVAGLGGGRAPLFMHHYLPDAIIDCVEIEPVMVKAATRFFGLIPDERLRVTVEDAHAWLARQSPATAFDIMFIDAFLDNGSTPAHMTAPSYHRLCRDHLSPDGVAITNLIAEDPLLEEKIDALAAAFPHLTLCPMGEDNTVVFTATIALDRETLIERAIALQRQYRFSFPFARRAAELIIQK